MLKGVSTFATLPRAVFLLAAALLFMRSAENFYAPILPLYVRVLDASIPLFLVGLVVGIHRLGMVVASPIAGNWCDRIGYRKPFIIGVIATSVASVLGGLAFGAADLTFYRILSGLGYGTLSIAVMVFVNSVTTPQNRATAMSLLSASALAGAALGPLPGGYIAESLTPVLFGYRATFYGGGLVQILVGVYAFFLIRGRGMVTAQVAPTSSGGSLYTLALRHKGVAITSLCIFLFGLSYGAFLFFTVPLLGESLGFGPVRIGWIISSFGFGHVIGALIMGPLSDKMGRRKPFVFLALLSTGVLLLLFSLVDQVLLMVAITSLIGFLSAPLCGIVPAMVCELLPESPASAMALQRSAENLGIFVGPILGGLILSISGFSTALIAYAAITIVGSLIFLLGVREPLQSTRPTGT